MLSCVAEMELCRLRRGKLTVPELQAVGSSPPAGKTSSTGRNELIVFDESRKTKSFFEIGKMHPTSLTEWRKLPLGLSELCINTTLRCGQSFRFVDNRLYSRPN
jgi:hypothetical protein